MTKPRIYPNAQEALDHFHQTNLIGTNAPPEQFQALALLMIAVQLEKLNANLEAVMADVGPDAPVWAIRTAERGGQE